MADYFYLNAQNEQKGPIAAEDLIKNGVTKKHVGVERWYESMATCWKRGGIDGVFPAQTVADPSSTSTPGKCSTTAQTGNHGNKTGQFTGMVHSYHGVVLPATWSCGHCLFQ